MGAPCGGGRAWDWEQDRDTGGDWGHWGNVEGGERGMGGTGRGVMGYWGRS